MSEFLKIYPILLEAYEHYTNTTNRHFIVLPKNPEYLLNVLNSVQTLKENGYIDNVSDNLLNDSPINIYPVESMSFDITSAGIEYVRANRNC